MIRVMVKKDQDQKKGQARTSDRDHEQDNRSGVASGSELGSGPWIRIIIRKRTQDLDWVQDQDLDQVPDYNEDL